MVKENLPARSADAVRDQTWRTRRLSGSLLLSQADIDFLNAMRPRCATCGGLVERFSWRRALGERAVTFRAECHGDFEETTLGFEQLPALMLGGVQDAKAFASPKRIKGKD